MTIKCHYFALLLTAIFAVTFTSCEKEDELTLNDQIQGEWFIFNWVGNGEVLDLSEFNSISYSFTRLAGNEGLFSLNIDHVDDLADGVIRGTYELDGNQITMISEGVNNMPGQPYVATISVNEDVLVISDITDENPNGDLLQARR
jgi:hypothetical protein